MKQTIFVITLCLLIINCQSQKVLKSTNHQKKDIDNKNYFLGNWILRERNYRNKEEKKTYPLHECEKKYSLVFKKENGNIFLTKNYTTGKNCEIKNNSGKILISITESSFSYIDLDVKKTEQYKIISSNEFSILYNEILDGKIREIEDIYERF